MFDQTEATKEDPTGQKTSDKSVTFSGLWGPFLRTFKSSLGAARPPSKTLHAIWPNVKFRPTWWSHIFTNTKQSLSGFKSSPGYYTYTSYICTLSQKSSSTFLICNFKKSYQILIISVANIPDTTCYQINVQLPTSCVEMNKKTINSTYPDLWPATASDHMVWLS